MSEVDPKPPEHILKERRKPKYVLDPNEVTAREKKRLMEWSRDLIVKHESKLSFSKWKHGEIIASGIIEPESIDVGEIYSFGELNWYIYRSHDKWNVLLRSHHRVLSVASYAKL